MITRVLFFIAVVFLSFTGPVKAQQDPQEPAPPQLGSFETDYTYSPFTVGNEKMNIQQVNGTLTLPLFNRLQNGKHNFLLAGIGYSGLFLSGAGNKFEESKFYSISVPLTFQQSFSPKYALIASFIPTLSSDLKDVSTEDMFYSGALMLRIRNSGKFSYSVGAVFSKQFFGTLLIPIVGVDWNISSRWSFSGTLPVAEKIKYLLSDKSAIGINAGFGIGGGSYRLSKKQNSAYFQVQQFKSAVFYNYTLAKNLSIEVSAGYNFTQQLDVYSKDQKVNWVPFNSLNKRVPIAELKKTGIAIQTGIHYGF